MKKALFCFGFVFSIFCLSQEKKDTIDKISEKQIQEIILKSQRKKQFSDHANYTFDKKAIDQARHAKDLLTSLPELQLDLISNTIVNVKGGKTLFLINGVEAADNQIKSLAPNNVIRVEYFDIPPARYSQRADTVVNIIIKNPEVGYSYGIDVTSALTTGFVNASSYAGYTEGNNDFGFEYSINLRDYNNRVADKTYDYKLNNIYYRSEEQQKDHFGYTDQNIALRYANAIQDKYTFQSKLNFYINSSFNQGIGNSIFIKDSSLQNHNTIHNSGTNYIAPNLDLYYSKNLNNNRDEFSFNLIGSYYNTKSNQFDHEWVTNSSIDIFNNDMILRAKQTGIVGEIAHVHIFEKGKLSSGYRITNTNIYNNLVNLLGNSDHSVNYLNQYLYTEYSGKKDKFSYRLGIGITSIHNRSSETTQNDWAPTPKIVLSYGLAKNQSLRFSSQYSSQSPFASVLSNNVKQIAPNIVQKGNPFLKVQHTYKNSLVYSFNNKYFDLNTTVFYNLMNNYFSQFFQLDATTGGYSLIYENAKKYTEAGIQISGSISPFGNELLVLKSSIIPKSVKLEAINGTMFKSNFIQNSFALISQYKNFSAYYQFNFPIFTFNGSFLNKDENQNQIFLAYHKNNSGWTFSSGVYWLGTPSKYDTKSLPRSLVTYSNQSYIYNNKNMFVLGISYDFSSGKQIQIQKKLNNSTAPAATF